MKENVLMFGKEPVMVGIMTEPDQVSGADQKPMILLLNAGVVHRVGPYRQWVDLAWGLCKDGYTVFRFDMTGIGDSTARKDRRRDIERAILDIREMMDHLQQSRGVKQFVLVGLCSGSDYGHPVTVADPRVVGTVFMDGMGYRTKGWYTRYYLQRLADPWRWKNRFFPLILEFWKRIFAKVGLTPSAPEIKQFERDFPTQVDAQVELQQLVDRGVNMLFMFTSGVSRYFNYIAQFRAMFPQLKWKDKIEVEIYPEFDHTFTLLSHRSKVHERIRNWMSRFSSNQPKSGDSL